MRRIGKAVLSTLIFFSVLILLPLSVSASVKKKDTSREIAIVFDNSGSMFKNNGANNKAWSEAKYAIEVFASMLNDGDQLKVYPMNPVTIDGKEYSGNNPVVIGKPGEARKIESMLTTDSGKGDTPIDTIKLAHDGVKSSDKDEKWLLVLTDGAEFYDKDHKYVDCEKDQLEILSAPGTDDDGKISALKDSLSEEEKKEKATTVGAKRALSTMLSECADDVNTVYLGIGSAAVEPEIKGKFSKGAHNAESAEVPAVLGYMCNAIFGRNELPTDGETITFDIPLSKLIVLVQGEDIADVTLTGKDKLTHKDRQQVKFSEESGTKGPWTANTGLQGVVTTFVDGLVKDENYKLAYTGNESDTKVYYEPDVDLFVDIVDIFGNSVISSQELYDGDYEIVYRMVDPEGNDVSQSQLLGETTYDIGFTLNGTPIEMPDNKKAGKIKVTLKSGDVLGFDKADVTFLNNYTISKTAEDIGFASNGNPIVEKPNTLSFEITGGKDTYQRASFEDEASYEIKAFYNGEPIDMGKVENLQIQVGEGGAGVPIANLSSDGKTVTMTYCDDAQGTDTGEHILKVAGSYTDEYGNATVGTAQKPFTIADDSKALSATLSTDGDFYLIKKLGNGTPIYLTVMVDGSPLTDEEMNLMTETPGAITLTTGEGLSVDTKWTPLYGKSTFKVEILQDGTKEGIHTVNARAILNSRNQLYTPADATGEVNIKALEPWKIYVAIGLLVLLLALILWLISRIKMLPASITNNRNDTTGSSDGEELGYKKIKYERRPTVFGRMFGEATLRIQSEVDVNNRSTSIKLRLKPKTTLWDAVFNRDAGTVEATLMDPSIYMQEVRIGGTVFTFDEEMRKLVDAQGKPSASHPVIMRNVSVIDFTQENDGNTMNYSTKARLKWW